MRGQQTFSDMEYSRRKRVTKREGFLKEMNENHPMGRMGRIHPSILSQRGTGTTPERNRNHAADVSAAGVVQSVG